MRMLQSATRAILQITHDDLLAPNCNTRYRLPTAASFIVHHIQVNTHWKLDTCRCSSSLLCGKTPSSLTTLACAVSKHAQLENLLDSDVRVPVHAYPPQHYFYSRALRSSISNTNRLPLSPRLMRKLSSTNVVSSQPRAESGAVTGMRFRILNCSNLTATRLLLSGVSEAVTALKYGHDSLLRALSLGASALSGSVKCGHEHCC